MNILGYFTTIVIEADMCFIPNLADKRPKRGRWEKTS